MVDQCIKINEVGQRENLEVRKNKWNGVLNKLHKRIQNLSKYNLMCLENVQVGLKGGENMITLRKSYNY